MYLMQNHLFLNAIALHLHHQSSDKIITACKGNKKVDISK